MTERSLKIKSQKEIVKDTPYTAKSEVARIEESDPYYTHGKLERYNLRIRESADIRPRNKQLFISFVKWLTSDATAHEKRDNFALHRLASEMAMLGFILRQRNDPSCIPLYEDAIKLVRQLGEKESEALYLFQLGHAYFFVSQILDLDKAETCYRHSLKLRRAGDSYGQAQCLGQLGMVAARRVSQVLTRVPRDGGRLRELLTLATECYSQALSLMPDDYLPDLASLRRGLADVYYYRGDFEESIRQCEKAIEFYEVYGSVFNAANARHQISNVLAMQGRFGQALEYARAALRNYQHCGEGESKEVKELEAMIHKLEGIIQTTE
jgi:tetratricopeptide (TPR) repeat protein